MRQQEINYWITAMLNKHARVSDLNLTVGKSLQVDWCRWMSSRP